MTERYLSGPAYELGESGLDFTSLPGLSDVMRTRKLPSKPELLGISRVFVLEDIYRLVEASIAKSLAASELQGSDIDGVIFCSSQFLDDASRQNNGYARALIAAGIDPQVMFCVTGTGCVSLLTGIGLAIRLLETSSLRRFAVVNIDFFEGEPIERLRPHALLSDAVSSVIVGEPGNSANLSIRSFVERTDVVRMRDGVQIRDFAHGRDAVAECLRGAGRDVGDIAFILSNNIFLPLKQLKDGSHGFKQHQMKLDNVAAYGHCYASDALINLSDHLEGAREDQDLLIYSEADGHTACLVITTRS